MIHSMYLYVNRPRRSRRSSSEFRRYSLSSCYPAASSSVTTPPGRVLAHDDGSVSIFVSLLTILCLKSQCCVAFSGKYVLN